MFPGKAKKAYTKQGKHFRWWIAAFCTGHALFFFVSLAIIGFEPMVNNIIFTAWMYSLYLTLSECLTIAYLFGLVMTMYYNYQHEYVRHVYKDMNNLEILGWLALFSFYVFSLCTITPIYLRFRINGGRKGYGNNNHRNNAVQVDP